MADAASVLRWLPLSFAGQADATFPSGSAGAQMAQLLEVRPALQQLAQAGIPCMLLKGAALIALGWVPLGARPMQDLDVLVPPEHFVAALGHLVRTGWVVRGKQSAHFPQTLTAGEHAVSLQGPNHAHLDLHWAPFLEGRAVGHSREIWQRSRTVSFLGLAVQVPSPTDLLLLLCVHGYRKTGGACRWPRDLRLLVQQVSGELDSSLLLEEVARRRLVLPVLALLQTVPDAPPALLRWLGELPVRNWELLDFLIMSSLIPQNPLHRLFLPLLDYNRCRRADLELGGLLGFLARRWSLGASWQRSTAVLVRLEARLCLGLAHLCVRVLPTRIWRGRAVTRPHPATVQLTERQLERSRVVAAQVRNASARCTCLVRALAAQWMLWLRGIPSTLWLGARIHDDALDAHAWLQCGERVVLGERSELAPLCGFSA